MNQCFMKERPVVPLVISMALPMTLSMLVNALYNIVDSYFVAKISEDAMTALSFVFPVQNLMTAVGVGFAIGINAVIAFFMGAEEQNKADAAASAGMLLNIIHGAVLMVVCLAGMPLFLRLFTKDEGLIRMSLQYADIVLLFCIPLTTEVSFEKIFQSVGRMTASMTSMILGCLVNIILDPCLIFGIGIFPELGIRGAAIATGIGQLISLIVYLLLYHFRPIPVKITRISLKGQGELIRRIYSIGIPATLNLALPSVMISALNGILAAFSQSYVLVLGAYYKLQTFLYLTGNGVIQGMRPLLGYNYGAGETKRVRQIFATCLTIIAGVMVIGTVLCQIIPGSLIGLFTVNEQTIAQGITALRIISGGFIVSSVSMTICGALEGLGKGKESFWISALRYVIFILPLAYLLSRRMEAAGVWHAFWITELLSAIVSFFIYRKCVSRMND